MTMNKMKRAVVTLMAALMATSSIASFAGCQEKDNRTKIVFYHTMGAALKGILDKYLPEFHAMYPNYKVEHSSSGDYDGLRNEIITELSAGDSPSIAYCYPDHVALYMKSRRVVALDDYISSTKTVSKADGTSETLGYSQAQLDDFIEIYYEEGANYGDGKMYSLPFSKSTEVLYYNKTFFEEHELTVPTTWDQMETVCAQIVELTEKSVPDPEDPSKTITVSDIPLGYDSESNWFITMTEQLGTNYTKVPENSTDNPFTFNTAENRAFVERFRGWYQKGYVTTEEIFGSYTSELFTRTDATKQKCYMCIGSTAGATYQCPDLVLDPDTNENVYPFEVGVTQIPQANPEQPKVIQQGPSLCLFKKSEAEMDAAWLFAKWLTTNVNLQAEVSMNNGYAPVIKSVNENSIYKTFLDNADGNKFLQATAVKQAIAQQDAYYLSPAFDGSSAAREQVGLLLQNCFLHELADKEHSSAVTHASDAALVEYEFNEILKKLKNDYGY